MDAAASRLFWQKVRQSLSLREKIPSQMYALAGTPVLTNQIYIFHVFLSRFLVDGDGLFF